VGAEQNRPTETLRGGLDFAGIGQGRFFFVVFEHGQRVGQGKSNLRNWPWRRLVGVWRSWG